MRRRIRRRSTTSTTYENRITCITSSQRTRRRSAARPPSTDTRAEHRQERAHGSFRVAPRELKPRLRLTLLGLALVVAGCGGDGQAYPAPSSAMEPTIHCARPNPGCEADAADTLVVESFSGSPERGDILLFETPPSVERKCGISIERLIKRVIALPGETWEMRDGDVFIDGERLAETYVT